MKSAPQDYKELIDRIVEQPVQVRERLNGIIPAYRQAGPAGRRRGQTA